MTQNVLFVTTSTGQLPDEQETGFDWPSLVIPYWRLREAGVNIGFASVGGGKPPGDPATARDADDEQIGSVNMFLSDEAAILALADSAALSDVDPTAWSGLLFVGGLGALWDMAGHDAMQPLVSQAWAEGGILAAIGTGTVALLAGRDESGRALVSGRRVACVADAEIDARLDGIEPPIRPATSLRDRGALVLTPDGSDEPVTVEDGRLITGSDPRAAADVTLQFLDALDVYAPPSERGAGEPGSVDRDEG